MSERTAAAYTPEEAFELADAIVNWGGYADDEEEADRRAERRDALAVEISRCAPGDMTYEAMLREVQAA